MIIMKVKNTPKPTAAANGNSYFPSPFFNKTNIHFFFLLEKLIPWHKNLFGVSSPYTANLASRPVQ